MNTPTPTCGELSCDECNNRTAALTAERDQLRAALALGQQNCDDAYEDLRDERDAARVELATCKGTSELLLESLRAEVQRLKSDGAASAFVDMACRASRAEAEVERLRSDRDCEKRLRKDAEELREDAIERAERAKGEVSKLTDALDMMRDEFMRIIACPGCDAEIEDLANRAQLKLIQRVPVITQRDRAEADLATERARLDWLNLRAPTCWSLIDAQMLAGKTETICAAIDAAMKEETK